MIPVVLITIESSVARHANCSLYSNDLASVQELISPVGSTIDAARA
ncbi:MAG: hypothetical protein IJH65_04750 [Methanobrevibacter sp.]|nr:hypothetical protein [Methanobrevibacter sp.]